MKGTSLSTGTISTMRGWKKQIATLLITAMDIVPRLRSVKALLLTRVQLSSFLNEISSFLALAGPCVTRTLACFPLFINLLCLWCIFKLPLVCEQSNFFCFISAILSGWWVCECYVGDGVYPIAKLCNNWRSHISYDIETGIFFICSIK